MTYSTLYKWFGIWNERGKLPAHISPDGGTRVGSGIRRALAAAHIGHWVNPQSLTIYQ